MSGEGDPQIMLKITHKKMLTRRAGGASIHSYQQGTPTRLHRHRGLPSRRSSQRNTLATGARP